MAYYNPQYVQFQPSSGLIESAGAVGNFLYKKGQDDYQRALQEQQNQRLLDQFNFQKERAGVQDAQWDKTYQAGRDDRQTANEQWQAKMLQDNMFHKDTVDYQNKHLGISQQSLGLQQEAQARKAREDEAVGRYIASIMPELAKQTGAQVGDNQTREDVPFGVVPTQATYNPKKLQDLAGMLNIVLADKKIEAEAPYKQMTAQTNAFRAQEYADNLKAKQKEEADKQTSINATKLRDAYYKDPKSILGIDPEELSDADKKALFDDINRGVVGSYKQAQVPTWYGTRSGNVYVPHGSNQQTPTQQQTTNNAPYPDGTILKGKDGRQYKVVNGQPVAL